MLFLAVMAISCRIVHLIVKHHSLVYITLISETSKKTVSSSLTANDIWKFCMKYFAVFPASFIIQKL